MILYCFTICASFAWYPDSSSTTPWYDMSASLPAPTHTHEPSQRPPNRNKNRPAPRACSPRKHGMHVVLRRGHRERLQRELPVVVEPEEADHAPIARARPAAIARPIAVA